MNALGTENSTRACARACVYNIKKRENGRGIEWSERTSERVNGGKAEGKNFPDDRT